MKLRKTTEKERDIIGIMQGYLGAMVLTYILMFKPWILGLV